MIDRLPWATPVGADSWVAPLLLLLGVSVALALCFLALVLRSRKYQVRLTRRYLLTRFSSLAAYCAITFGVAIILVVLSIMGGYVETFRERLRGQESHLSVLGNRPYSVTHVTRVEETIRGVENVRATAPFIKTLAMYRSGGFNHCQIRGVDIKSHVDVTDLGKYSLRPRELEAVLRDFNGRGRESRTEAIKMIDAILKNPDRQPLTSSEFEQFFDVSFRRQLIRQVHGPRVANEFETSPPPQAALVGIQLLLTGEMFLGQIVPIATLEPETSKPAPPFSLLVAGAFKTGTFEADKRILYTNVHTLRNKLNLFDVKRNSSRYEEVRVAVKDLSKLDETRGRLQEALLLKFPELEVYSWEQLGKNKIEAIEREKYLIYVLLVFLIAFTAFMILLMLVLTVIEKTRDIGIMLALGATPSGIIGIFLINGLVLTLAGTISGLTLGYAFCLNINPLHDWVYVVSGISLFPPDVYDMDRIPIAFQFGDALLSIAPALALGFLASLVPAVWASRRDPIKAIHYQ